ncbi:hypothetical protein BGZ46_004075, partial [Entomortierella lignicola]
MGRITPIEMRGQVVGMMKSRKSGSEIAKELVLNDRTVRLIIQRHNERGTVETKPIPGRPQKL